MAELAVAGVAAYAAAAGTAAATGVAMTSTAALMAAQWGWLAGSLIGSMLFQDRPDGPRMRDTKVGGQQYGNPMWKPWGTIRGAGQIIWSSDLIEHANQQGKGKRGGTTYDYTVDCAIAICEGPIDAVLRIWANGICIYDVNNANPEVNTDTAIISEEGITVYLGDEDQEVSSLMEGYIGAGKVPAYRGTAYVTFEGLQLARFGNRLPSFEFEVTTNALPESTATTRTTIAYPIRSGYSFVDFAPGQMAKITDGFLLLARDGEVDQYDNDGNFVRTFDGVDSLITSRIAYRSGSRYAWVHGGNIFFGVCDLQTGFSTIQPVFAAFLVTDIHPHPTRDAAAIYCEFGSAEAGIVQYDSGANTFSVDVSARWIFPDGAEVGEIGLGPTDPLSGNPIRVYGCPLNAVYTSTFYWSDGITSSGTVVVDEMPGAFITSVAYDPPTGRLVLTVPPASTFPGVYILDGTTFDLLYYIECRPNTQGRAQRNPINGRWLIYDPTVQKVYEFRVTDGQIVRTYSLLETGDASWTLGEHFAAAEGGGFYSVDYGNINPGTQADGEGILDNHGVLNLWRAGGDGIEAGPVKLKDIVTDLLTEAGLESGTDFDVENLTDDVRGYLRSRPMAARAAIEPLQAGWYFDLPEIDWMIQSVRRGGESEITIDADDIVPAGDGEGAVVEISRREDLDLPRQLTVAFRDVAANYDPGTQDARREVTQATGKATIELPIVFTATEARERAHVNLAALWMERDTLKVTLPTKYLRISPATPITLPLQDGSLRRVAVKQVTMDGSRVEIVASMDDASAYTQPATGVEREELPPSAESGGAIQPIVATDLLLLDLPLLSDEDDAATPRVYWAASRSATGRWPGTNLYRSVDGGSTFTLVGETADEVTVGTTVNALADWAGGNRIDRDSVLDVTIPRGVLESRSLLALLNGSNMALVGDELIQFGTVEQIGPTTWRLSGLLRGRRGTEWAIGGHAAGERFVYLSRDWVQTLGVPLIDVGAVRTYKAVTTGNAIADAAAASFTTQGAGLRPYSPVHLAGEWSGGDLVITWTRRTRVGGEMRGLVDVPLSEVAESYEIDIWDDAFTTRKRVLTASSPTVTYTAAQAAADFGVAPATVGVRVYQISDKVGRGNPGRAVLPGGSTEAEGFDGSSSATAPT